MKYEDCLALLLTIAPAAAYAIEAREDIGWDNEQLVLKTKGKTGLLVLTATPEEAAILTAEDHDLSTQVHLLKKRYANLERERKKLEEDLTRLRRKIAERPDGSRDVLYEEMESETKRLSEENEQLRRGNTSIANWMRLAMMKIRGAKSENARLAAENERLTAENEELAAENEELRPPPYSDSDMIFIDKLFTEDAADADSGDGNDLPTGDGLGVAADDDN